MDLRLLLGASLIGLSAISYAICFLGARNPREPGWANEFMMSTINIPLIVSGLALGLMLILESLTVRLDSLTMIDLLAAGLIVASSFATIKLMRISKRVAAYEQGKTDSNKFSAPKGGAMGAPMA